MTTERKDYYTRLIERLGISTVLLGVVIFGIYELAGWLGPRADKMLDKHIEIVDKAMSIGEMNSRTLEKVGEAQETQAEILNEIHRSVVPQKTSSIGPRPAGSVSPN